jgi:hypothetical protein
MTVYAGLISNPLNQDGGEQLGIEGCDSGITERLGETYFDKFDTTFSVLEYNSTVHRFTLVESAINLTEVTSWRKVTTSTYESLDPAVCSTTW